MTEHDLRSPESTDLLVLATDFDRGGWVLDSQFQSQMGGSYLLAHGLGNAVADASASFEVPQPGEYHVWVRAKDWVPEHHPGRFTLTIGGRTLETEFGANGRDWSWERAGSVALPAGTTRIELHDLTGFDGRCEAIYLSRNVGGSTVYVVSLPCDNSLSA